MIDSEELDRHADEMAAKLEGKVDRDTVRKELEKYVSEYGISIEVAESGILKKFSAPRTAAVSGDVTKKVADFRGDEMSCTMTVKIISCQSRTVNTKTGSKKNIVSGTAGDDTGTIPFSIWSENPGIEVGKVYKITKVYGRKFRDAPQMNVGSQGKITPVDEDIQVSNANPVGPSSEAVTKKVSELTGDEANVNITLQIVSVENNRQITTKNGDSRKITSGIAGDDTGTVAFTIWAEDKILDVGATYTFCGAYCRKFRDAPQINLGDRGEVKPSDAHFDIKSAPVATSAAMPIGSITESTGFATVTGKVIDISTRKVNIRGEDRTVWGGTIADESGKIQFSAWEDLGILKDNAYTFSNVSVRAWRSIPQLNINSSSSVTLSDAQINVKTGADVRTVEEVSRAGGAMDVSITGIIVDVKTGSGLIKRCPVCRRALRDGRCNFCNTDVTDPVDDLRLKTTIDDGTGAISVIIGRSDTEALTGVTLDEARSAAQNAGDSSAISNRMASKVLLKRVTVTGNVMTDEKFGPQMSARSLTEVSTDVRAEAEKLLSDMEELM